MSLAAAGLHGSRLQAVAGKNGNWASFNLGMEISPAVPWQVEILNEAVANEMAALPADIQARFVQLTERIRSVGLEGLSAPIVRQLEGTLWELRLTGRDGIARALHVAAMGPRVVVVRAFVKTQKTPRAEIDLALERSRDIKVTIPFETLIARLRANTTRLPGSSR